MVDDPRPPFRVQFDNARDPYTARNALGIVPSGTAPTDAEYITAVDDPTLTNDRVLTNTATVTWDLSTPGQVKANVGTAVKDAFCATRGGTDQTGFTSGIATKCLFNVEVFDQNGKYDNATNYRWTPAAGLVLIYAQVYMYNTTSADYAQVFIYKNGSMVRRGTTVSIPAAGAHPTVTMLEVANGTDYYECYALATGSVSGTLFGDITYSFFQGVQL